MTDVAVPSMLIGYTNYEGTAAQQAQEKAMYTAGYMGWVLYGALSSFNVLYYFDIYKRQYMDNPHSGWDKMAFQTLFGGSSFIRLHINMVGWFMMLVGWVFSCFGWTFPVFHQFFYGLTQVFAIIWLVRIFMLLLIQLIALMIDNHKETHAVFNYFQHGHAWGAELHVEDLYDTLDIELEAFNIMAQMAAYALYSIGQPLFIDQIENQVVISQNGSSCQLCFKKRNHMHEKVEETQPEAKEKIVDEIQPEAKKSDWESNCAKIKNECELEAKREAQKVDNRRRIAYSPSTDFIF